MVNLQVTLAELLLSDVTWVIVSCLLVKFEGVAESVQAFRLLRVCISKGLRRSFEEVLVVAHLGYWHTMKLVWTRDRKSPHQLECLISSMVKD